MNLKLLYNSMSNPPITLKVTQLFLSSMASSTSLDITAFPSTVSDKNPIRYKIHPFHVFIFIFFYELHPFHVVHLICYSVNFPCITCETCFNISLFFLFSIVKWFALNFSLFCFYFPFPSPYISFAN